jgi:quinol-cytochrome oxidoreductase complex cytochrome b subunit
LTIVSNVFLHLHPVKVRKSGLKLSYTWGLGGLSAFLFLVLAVTGALLMFEYVPSVERAYADIVRIQSVVPFGALIRNIHRWSAELMMVTVFLHLCRVFYTGAYKPPREFNWIVGLVLLLLTLADSFTGYLLPWDQIAYWALTVGANIASYAPLVGDYVRSLMLGGPVVGQPTLIRFYNLHVFIVPASIVAVMAIHFWRIRKDGGISGPSPEEKAPREPEEEGAHEIFPPDPDKTYGLMALTKDTPPLAEKEIEDTVMTFPNLVIIEVLAALAMTVLLLFLSALRDAPLEEIANPDLTPNPAKAAWYLMSIQELIMHMHPTLGSIILPTVVILALAALPYIDYRTEGIGHWFHSRRGKRIALLTAVGTLVVVPALVALNSLVGVRSLWPGVPSLVAGWIIPLGVVLGLLSLLYFFLRRARLSTREVAIAYFTIFAVSIVVLTILMSFFRGPGMGLYWPWAMPEAH